MEGRIRGVQTSGLPVPELRGALPSWTNPTARAEDSFVLVVKRSVY